LSETLYGFKTMIFFYRIWSIW